MVKPHGKSYRVRRRCPFCFGPGTLVYSNPSLIPIEEMQHVEHHYEGDLVKVKTRYFPEVRVTAGEMLLTRHGRPVFTRRDGKVWESPNGQIAWKSAGFLLSTHKKKEYIYRRYYLVVPKPAQPEEVFPVLEFKRNTHRMRDLGDLRSEDWMRFFGWYVAEGSTGTDVQLAISVKDMDEVTGILDSLNLPCRITGLKGEKAVQVNIGNRVLANNLPRWFGRGAKNKRLPEFIMTAKESRAKAFLEGYIHGDGSTDSEGHVEVKSASDLLVRQVQYLLLRLGVLAYYSRGTTRSSVINGRKIRESTFSVLWFGGRRPTAFEDASNFYVPIRRISAERYSGPVYDVKTEDSMVRLPFVAHNCGMIVNDPRRFTWDHVFGTWMVEFAGRGKILWEHVPDEEYEEMMRKQLVKLAPRLGLRLVRAGAEGK